MAEEEENYIDIEDDEEEGGEVWIFLFNKYLFFIVIGPRNGSWY